MTNSNNYWILLDKLLNTNFPHLPDADTSTRTIPRPLGPLNTSGEIKCQNATKTRQIKGQNTCKNTCQSVGMSNTRCQIECKIICAIKQFKQYVMYRMQENNK